MKPRLDVVPVSADGRSESAQPWLFYATVLYLLAHSFTIPIVPLGPSWAVWPRLDDFAFALLVLARLATPPARVQDRRWRRLWLALYLTCVFVTLDYVVVTLPLAEGKSPAFGLFQTVRLIQYSLVFWCVSGNSLDRRRLRILSAVTLLVMVSVCLVAIGNFTGILPVSALVGHLPGMGPYQRMQMLHAGLMSGPYGYNHAYIAAQLTLLLVALSALGQVGHITLWSLAVLAGGVCFASGSRAGLVGYAVAVAMLFFSSVRGMGRRIVGVAIAALGLVLLLSALRLNLDFESVVYRQQMLWALGQEEAWVSRWSIWRNIVSLLNAEPILWLGGAGWGGAVETGGNAHMLPLQVVLETGVIGLALFVWVTWLLSYAAWTTSSAGRAFLLGSAGLAVSSVSQETFYPVPAMGSFLGAFLFYCGLLAALASKRRTEAQGGLHTLGA